MGGYLSWTKRLILPLVECHFAGKMFIPNDPLLHSFLLIWEQSTAGSVIRVGLYFQWIGTMGGIGFATLNEKDCSLAYHLWVIESSTLL